MPLASTSRKLDQIPLFLLGFGVADRKHRFSGVLPELICLRHGHLSGARHPTAPASLNKAEDYKAAGNLAEAVRRAVPNGLDVYFDNVGGAHLEAALTAANRFARFALCGMISQYNVAGMPAGPRNIMLAVGKSTSGSKALLSRTTSTCCPSFKRTCRGGYVKAN